MQSARKLIAAGLVLALLILANFIASSTPAKLDLTSGRLYSLSPGTDRILKNVTEPVEIEFYFSESAAGLPAFLRNYADRVSEMLRQYAARSDGKVRFRKVDPQPDTPEEERALRLGLQGQALAGSDQRIFLGVLMRQADSQKLIPFLNVQREPFLEYDLSQLLSSVQRLDRPKLGLLSGLPLRGRPGMPWAGQPGQPAQLVHQELEKTFEVVEIETTANEIPGDLTALAVVHPQGIGEQLEYALDQFILSGKPVFIAVDPASRFTLSQSQQAMFGAAPGKSSNLERLFKAYGIGFDPATVVGDERLGTRIPGSNGIEFAYPLLPNFRSENLASDSPLTSQLQQVMFVEPGEVRLADGSTLEFQPLIRTSSRSGTTPSTSIGLMPPEESAKAIVFEDRERAVAGFFRGSVRSAFPEGRPEVKPAEGESAPPPLPATNHLKESAGRINVFVAADSDWLMDVYSVRVTNFLGVQSYLPLNDNLGFAVNVLEAFAGSEDLISLRGKASSVRPFVVVDTLEREAQKRFQARLDSLDAELKNIEAEIGKVMAQQSEQRVIVATPDIQKSLDAFREQEARVRAERREIRRALREEIDALEARVVAVNLLTAPIVIALSGWAFHLWRKKRRLVASPG